MADITRDTAVLIGAYRRILRNAERGVGVRLSPEEVEVMACDPAVFQAPENAEQGLEQGQEVEG